MSNIVSPVCVYVSFKFSVYLLFLFRSELLVKQNNIEKPQTGLSGSTVSNSLCTWSALSTAFGLKLCVDYNYKNTTSFAAPYFSLAGPAYFDIYVQKSDPSANVYLFEYKWTQGHNLNVVSLTFDTPGSHVKRLMHANFTIEPTGNNLTMLMQSSAGVVLAKGRIKNTEDQKVFEVR